MSRQWRNRHGFPAVGTGELHFMPLRLLGNAINFPLMSRAAMLALKVVLTIRVISFHSFSIRTAW